MRKDLKKGGKRQNNQVSGRKQKHQVFSDEEYIRRAEKLERELFADGEWDEVDEPTDEEEARSYEELIKRLKAEGIYQEDDIEKNIDLETSSRVIPMYKKRSVRVGRVAGVAILCCACVFAASMTSEANRNYLVNNIRIWSGNDTKTVVGNNIKNEDINTAELQANEKIEKELNIDMPELYYRPNGFEFKGYEIQVIADIARVEYQYGEKIITFIINKEGEDTASNISSTHGKKIETINSGGEDLKISIEKTQDVQETIPNYTAQWERKNVVYYLSGKIEKEELEKILQNMVF